MWTNPRTIVVEFCPVRAYFDNIWPKFDTRRPNLGRVGPNVDRTQPIRGRIRPLWPRLAQIRPSLTNAGPISTEIGPMSAQVPKLDTSRANLGRYVLGGLEDAESGSEHQLYPKVAAKLLAMLPRKLPPACSEVVPKLPNSAQMLLWGRSFGLDSPFAGPTLAKFRPNLAELGRD